MGRGALHEACQGGHAGVVAVLADASDDIDAVDRDGWSAVHVAAFNGEVACLAILADRGNDHGCRFIALLILL